MIDNSDSLENVPGWLTTKQAGELFGVDRKTVVNWVWTGKLKAYNFGAMMAIPVEEVKRLRERDNGKNSCCDKIEG
jgi:excisionase family DNA binding protein